jgi:hypothetical protein
MPLRKRNRDKLFNEALVNASELEADRSRKAVQANERQLVKDAAIADDPQSIAAFAKQVLKRSLASVLVNGEIQAAPAHVGRIFSIDTFDEELVLRFFSLGVGQKNIPCRKCSALMFMDECSNANDVLKKGVPHEFMMCCRNGNVSVPQSPPISHEFKKMVLNHLGNQLPALNAKVAFAGVSSYKAEVPGKQYGFKILGPYDRVICTNLMASPTFAGIYIWDAEEQIRLRSAIQGNMEDDDIMTSDTVSFVTKYLMDNNPFAVTLRLASAEPHKPVTLLSSATYTMRAPASRGGQVAVLLPNDGTSRSHFAVTTLKGNRIRESDALVLHMNDSPNPAQSQRINYDHASYDALRFPILFPTGVYGWHRSFQSVNRDRRVSLREYYSFMLQDRPYENNLLMDGKRLLQEYIVDAAAKIEDSELLFQSTHQKELRADKYDNIKRAIEEGFTGTLGHLRSKPQVMNKSMRNSPGQKAAKYKDFVAAFRHHAGVDAFVTMTANPNWPEVLSALKPGASPEDRSDIMNRVFKLKLAKLIKEINNGILGEECCVGYVIEFQKRGLPHAHIAIAFKEEWKLKSGKEVDLMVSAEIPDPQIHPKLNKIVLHDSIHCCISEIGNPASCIVDGVCKKGFPFDHRNDTILVDLGYPLYRRRNLHPSEIVKKGKTIRVTDSMVVPYSPVLSLLLNCHCNIQACSQIFDFKYFFKYFTKSAEAQIFYPNDDAKTAERKKSFAILKESIHEDDEINRYKIGRFIGTSDALWSIMGFELYHLSQPVLNLPVELPGEQTVFLRDNVILGHPERTMLTAFFDLISEQGDMPLTFDPSKKVKDLLYQDVPNHCVWNSGPKMWSLRHRKAKNDIVQIGRLLPPPTTQLEKWALWMLLRHISGPKSFDDILNGAPTFIAACSNRGLLINDFEYEQFMEEVVAVEMPRRCRQIFADLLCSVAVPNPWALWDRFAQHLAQDFLHEARNEGESMKIPCIKHTLWSINVCLINQGSSLHDFKFPLDSYCPSTFFEPRIIKTNAIICQETAYTFVINDKFTLNREQLLFFEAVERSIEDKNPKKFILQAPGGTGKTHTLNMIIKYCLFKGINVAVTSSTGISATALIGGRTVHSAFNAGVTVPNEGCSFSVSPSSKLAKEWSQVDVLIIDEVMCLDRRFVEAIEITLQKCVFVDDLRRLDMGPFCGMTIIMTGDPRQQVPISPSANKTTLLSLCIHSSHLFKSFEQHHLCTNVRIHPSISFAHDDGTIQSLQNWILQIGDGQMQKDDLNVDDAHFVRIPNQFYSGNDLFELADRIYGDISEHAQDNAMKFFAERIILSPLYRDVQTINNIMIERFANAGYEIETMYSKDTVTGKFGDEEIANEYSASCFPEHKLRIFIGCPVMILRKYSGQVNNGDRAVIVSISTYRLGLRMLSGSKIGRIVHMPRMIYTPTKDSMRLEMQRLQFGIVVSFGITVSKSQSCGFKNVGIWLNDHLFAHGHLYLALSRLQVSSDGDYSLLFASRKDIMKDHRGVFAKNIVYKEVLAAYKC